MAAGIVLTGGSAKMEGAIELAEEVFHMPVRLGVPQFVEGLGDVVRNPIHATGVGSAALQQTGQCTARRRRRASAIGIEDRVRADEGVVSREISEASVTAEGDGHV